MIALSYDYKSLPFEPLDSQILRVLIREATRAENGGILKWHGLKEVGFAGLLHVKGTIENNSAIRRALYILERKKKAHRIRHDPRLAWRWFPSTNEVIRNTFHEQVKLERFL
ncbi:unnamed protein product [marine sediment metagenome]|uniref:Uncharacterized protein n=1 Tax=marine sediment metagenome TaxID=412755 RepID=X1N3V3_9ZZZZ